MQPDDILTRDIPLPTRATIGADHFISAGGVAYAALVGELAAARAENAEWQRTALALQEQNAALKAQLAAPAPKDEAPLTTPPPGDTPADALAASLGARPEPEPAPIPDKRPVGYVSPYAQNGST